LRTRTEVPRRKFRELPSRIVSENVCKLPRSGDDGGRVADPGVAPGCQAHEARSGAGPSAEQSRIQELHLAAGRMRPRRTLVQPRNK